MRKKVPIYTDSEFRYIVYARKMDSLFKRKAKNSVSYKMADRTSILRVYRLRMPESQARKSFGSNLYWMTANPDYHHFIYSTT